MCLAELNHRPREESVAVGFLVRGETCTSCSAERERETEGGCRHASASQHLQTLKTLSELFRQDRVRRGQSKEKEEADFVSRCYPAMRARIGIEANLKGDDRACLRVAVVDAYLSIGVHFVCFVVLRIEVIIRVLLNERERVEPGERSYPYRSFDSNLHAVLACSDALIEFFK